MALPNVEFNTQNGALGNLNIGADSTSVLYFHALPRPATWGKDAQLFLNIKQLENAGIVKGHATYGVVHYHVAEFLRTSNNGAVLGVVFGNNDTTKLFNSLIVDFKGEIRQVGVFVPALNSVVTDWEALSNSLDNEGIYNTVFIQGGYVNTGFTYSDLTTFNKPRVAYVGAGSLKGVGGAIVASVGAIGMSSLGAVLGVVAKSKVHECIGWPYKFNISDNEENEEIKLFDNSQPTTANIELIDNNHYLVMMKHSSIAGTYLSNSKTATDINDDFAYIERNRTIGKAKRLLRKALLPHLNAPIYVNNGKVSKNSIKEYEGYCNQAIAKMQGAGEVSAYSIYIDPNQDILTNSTLYIELKLVPVGVAREIIVNIGYTVNTTN